MQNLAMQKLSEIWTVLLQKTPDALNAPGTITYLSVTDKAKAAILNVLTA
jgi:hypothetical protein